MQFINEFRVQSDIESTFDALVDLENVASCFPGASLDGHEGEEFHGQITVKLGPMQFRYKGTARVVEADRPAMRGHIEATGRETRGTGTARADVMATLSEAADGGTLVKVVTDLVVTGRPAQMGKGVIAGVGEKLLEEFAGRLQQSLEQSASIDGGAGLEASFSDRSEVPMTEAAGGNGEDALDLVELLGRDKVRRIALAALGAMLALWWKAFRRRRDRGRA